MIISTGVGNWYSMWSGNYTPCLIGSSCEQNVKSLISFQYINRYIVYFADIICIAISVGTFLSFVDGDQ